MATYKHLRSSTANKRPTTSIADGQLAINTNTASPGLFFKDSAGTGIVKVGPVHVGTTAPNSVPAAGGSSGNYLGEQWLDTSVSPAQMKVWNGSAWVGVVADELPVSKLQDGAARQLIQTDAAGTGVEWTSNVDVPGTLDVTSTATFDSIAQHPLGSAAAPTLTFTGDPNTGIYSPGADQVAISTNGTGRLFVDASGNVGITESSPSSHSAGAGVPTLVLKGSSATFPSRSGALALVSQDGTSAKTWIYHDTDFFIQNTTATNTRFLTNNTERLRITSAGLVGIGTSSPWELLSMPFNSKLSFGSSAYPLSISRDATGSLVSTIADGYDASAARIDFKMRAGSANENTPLSIVGSGRVGIGTTSPGFDLTVDKDSNSLATAYVRSYNTGSSAGGRLIAASALGDLSMTAFSATHSVWPNTAVIASGSGFTGGLAIVAGGTSPLQLYTNGTERARIDSSGRLLVGTSSVRSVSSAFQGGGAAVALFQLETPDLATGIFSSNRNDQFGPYLALVKSRGTSSNAVTLVNSGDCIGGVTFNGTDGSTATTGAAIAAFVDGTPSANDMPGRLVFSVTADGASSPTEAMRIKNSRILNFANTPTYADNTAAKAGGLVNGDVYRKSDGTLMIVYT